MIKEEGERYGESQELRVESQDLGLIMILD
jgi:hypothetical protein